MKEQSLRKPFEIGEHLYWVDIDKFSYRVRRVMMHELIGEWTDDFNEGFQLEKTIAVLYQHYFDSGMEWIITNVIITHVFERDLFRDQESALNYAINKISELNKGE